MRRPDTLRLKYELLRRGESVANLARRVGLTRNYVSLVIHGGRLAPDAQRRVARAVGLRLSEAFPQEGMGRTGQTGRMGQGREQKEAV